MVQEEVDRASNTLRCDADALEANRSDSQAVGLSLREEREALLVLAGQLQVCWAWGLGFGVRVFLCSHLSAALSISVIHVF